MSAGFPTDTLAQFGASADALNATLTDRAATKGGRVGATRGIQAQLLSGREAVTMLHAVISQQFRNDPTFLAAWNFARRVNMKSGAVRMTGNAAVPMVSPIQASTPSSATTPSAEQGTSVARTVSAAA